MPSLTMRSKAALPSAVQPSWVGCTLSPSPSQSHRNLPSAGWPCVVTHEERGARVAAARKTLNSSAGNRGGQKGHRFSRRALLRQRWTMSKLCGALRCMRPLPELIDRWVKRYQATEFATFEPHTTEYRRHPVEWSGCRSKTRAPFDARIGSSPFGPRPTSASVLLTRVYHLRPPGTAQLLSDRSV